jgi:cytochrome oxidase Cu insertion factor (SCO1/SenC/PrrC family)/Cu/Ag efflux protein CusF
MIPIRAAVAALTIACVLALAGAARAADEHLHGVILGITPQNGEAVVRHDAFAGMPSMTMPFRILPRSRVGELQPGTTIDATVDRSTDPWTLRDVTVVDSQAVAAGPVIAHVPPLQLGDLVPDTHLLDQAGRPFVMSQLRGHDVVLAFIYTRCQDPRMCPLISAKFNTLQRLRGKRDLRLVEVTLDPSYDRPPVLARYGTMFGYDPKIWTLAVGDALPTLDFAARFGVVTFPDANAGIIHSENTAVIDADGRITTMIPDATWQPTAILAAIDANRHLASDPLARFDLWLSRTAVAICGPGVAAVSGLGDLAVMLAVFLALVYLLVRLARGIFAKSA